MSLSLYKVAGVDIKITNDSHEPYNYMQDFVKTNQDEADLNFLLQTRKHIQFPEGELISDNTTPFKWLKKASDQDGYYVYLQEFGVGKIMVLADIERDWRNAVVTWYDYTGDTQQSIINSQAQIWPSVHNMMGMVFRYCLLRFEGLVIHASTLKWNGKGVMFAAPSGTGKSTHVKLWQKYITDVTILNDDTPAVRIINNRPFVFGTPWSGSSFLHSNEAAPLAAIVLLEQAQENVLSRLDDQDAVLRLMPRAFLPYFDHNLMNEALNIFETIISEVPVYLLQCRPDKQSVELVHQCLI